MSLSQLLLLLFLVSPVEGFIDSDGVCSIFAFVPFTTEFRGNVWPSGGSVESPSYAFNHMAAAIMAVNHFNDKNTAIVKELANLNSCNVTLQLKNVIDTGTLTKLATQRLIEKSEKQGSFPCAIAGPFNDFPALELATVAQALKIPMVNHRGYNTRLVSDFFSGYTSQVHPDMIESSRNLVRFLLHKGRTNYIAFLYSLSDVNFQRRETLGFELDSRDINWTSSTYISPAAVSTFSTEKRTPLEALRKIKQTGYRTILLAFESIISDLPQIADAAEALGMNRGNYLWVFFETGLELRPFVLNNGNITKLVSGSMWTLPLTFQDPKLDPFVKAWRAQGKDDVDRLNDANPITPGTPGYYYANDTFFQDHTLAYGSSFIYDAVMTLGLGACHARVENKTISGDEHHSGVRAVNFTGASGRVAFGNDDGDDDRLGNRMEKTVGLVIFNIRTRNCTRLEDCVVAADYQKPNGNLVEIEQVLYADGTDQPPPLVDDPNMNLLSHGLRVAGLTLMSIAMSLAVASALFVFCRRTHRVLTASQPPFLYLVCFGAFVMSSAIFTISFDEGSGWNEEQLSKACMATPWLLCMGCIIVYGALFTKMWRVHEVLQFKKRQIKVQHVAWPMLILVVSALIVLTVWTIVEPLVWVRVPIDYRTRESIGECTGDHFGAFVAPLAVLVVIAMAVTGYFAWRTKDVDDAYTESKWIFILFLVQLEVALIATPIVVLLQDASAEGRYFGLVVMYWVFPMSTLALIILPKYIAYRRAVRGVDEGETVKRGQNVGTRVTGFETDSNSRSVTTSKAGGSVPTNEMQEVVAVESQDVGLEKVGSWSGGDHQNPLPNGMHTE